VIEEAPTEEGRLDLALPICVDDEAEHEMQHANRTSLMAIDRPLSDVPILALVYARTCPVSAR
jgi:hypothetical protein